MNCIKEGHWKKKKDIYVDFCVLVDNIFSGKQSTGCQVNFPFYSIR